MLDEIGGKVVMVSDQQAAFDFYTNKLELEKKVDMQFGTTRWIEVGTKKSSSTISLMEPSENNMSPDEVEMAKRSIGTPTGMWFYTYDIQKTHDELKSKNVDITEPKQQEWGGIMCILKDLDGNSFSLISAPTEQS